MSCKLNLKLSVLLFSLGLFGSPGALADFQCKALFLEPLFTFSNYANAEGGTIVARAGALLREKVYLLNPSEYMDPQKFTTKLALWDEILYRTPNTKFKINKPIQLPVRATEIIKADPSFEESLRAYGYDLSQRPPDSYRSNPEGDRDGLLFAFQFVEGKSYGDFRRERNRTGVDTSGPLKALFRQEISRLADYVDNHRIFFRGNRVFVKHLPEESDTFYTFFTETTVVELSFGYDNYVLTPNGELIILAP